MDLPGSNTSAGGIVAMGGTNTDGEFEAEQTDYCNLDEDHGNIQSEVPQTGTTLGSDFSYNDYIREQDYVFEWEAYEASRM
jgi:hypothetical protein